MEPQFAANFHVAAYEMPDNDDSWGKSAWPVETLGHALVIPCPAKPNLPPCPNVPVRFLRCRT